MKENEAIDRLQTLNIILTNKAGHEEDGIEKIFTFSDITAICTAIEALEEIQQYRAIGTVEGYKRALEISKENFRVSMEYKAKVQEFEAIGTIEELKVLKEKSVGKKAEWIFDDFTAKFGKPYRCSNCDEEFGDTYNYCPNCGCSMYD